MIITFQVQKLDSAILLKEHISRPFKHTRDYGMNEDMNDVNFNDNYSLPNYLHLLSSDQNFFTCWSVYVWRKIITWGLLTEHKIDLRKLGRTSKTDMTLSHFGYYPNAYSWKARTQIIKSDFSCHLYIVLHENTHENNFVVFEPTYYKAKFTFFFFFYKTK